MVEVIFDLKNQLLEDLEKDAQERGIDHLDKEKVDMVKDLAEAEKDCWKAEYYRSVTEAMEGASGYSGDMMGYGYGYSGMSGASGGRSGASYGGGGRSGAQSGGRSGASRGGGSGYRNSMGQFARRGYPMGYGMGYHEHIDALKAEMMNANPQEREMILQEIRGMGMMQ